MLVAIRHQGQKARTFDGGVELALVNRARASQAGRNNLAVFGNEVAQGIDIFVVNLLDMRYRKTAKALALEQQ